jgi:hypothetical protein
MFPAAPVVLLGIHNAHDRAHMTLNMHNSLTQARAKQLPFQPAAASSVSIINSNNPLHSQYICSSFGAWLLKT